MCSSLQCCRKFLRSTLGSLPFSEMFAALPKEAMEGSFFQGIKRFESNRIRSMLLSPSSYSTITPVFVVGVSGILGRALSLLHETSQRFLVLFEHK